MEIEDKKRFRLRAALFVLRNFPVSRINLERSGRVAPGPAFAANDSGLPQAIQELAVLTRMPRRGRLGEGLASALGPPKSTDPPLEQKTWPCEEPMNFSRSKAVTVRSYRSHLHLGGTGMSGDHLPTIRKFLQIHGGIAHHFLL